MADRGHTGSRYRALRAQVIREEDDCCRCGLPVDKTLPGTHRWGPSLDLRVPYVHGGRVARDNAALAHMRCNASYRDGRVMRLRPPSARFTPSGTC